jgi:hypothetical protein
LWQSVRLASLSSFAGESFATRETTVYTQSVTSNASLPQITLKVLAGALAYTNLAALPSADRIVGDAQLGGHLCAAQAKREAQRPEVNIFTQRHRVHNSIVFHDLLSSFLRYIRSLTASMVKFALEKEAAPAADSIGFLAADYTGRIISTVDRRCQPLRYFFSDPLME